MRMHGVAPGERRARNEDEVADLERPHILLAERRPQRHFAAGARESGLIEHRNDRVRRIAIQPAVDRAGRRIQRDAQAAKRPAVVCHRHEERSRETVEHADLAADERDVAAESHRADLEIVHGRHDRRLELRQPRIRIHVVERPKQLLLGVSVAGRAIATDADTDRPGRASLPLRVPHGVKNRFLDAVERPVRPAEMRQLRRQRVLRVGVLAASALENELDLDLVLLPLLEMDDRRAGPRLSPELVPVIESTELGRSLPRLVASATASRICCRIQIWFTPTGVFTSKVGMPVS